MAPKTAPLDFKQRKTRSSSLATPKKTKSLISEENVAPNSEVKLPRSTRNARLITDTKLRGVSPVKSPIKKKILQPVSHTPLASPLKSSPLKSIQLNHIVASPNKKVSTAKAKLFEEENVGPNNEVKLPRPTRNARVITDTKLRGVSPVKSPIKKKTLASPLKSSPLKSIQLNRIVASPNKKVSTAKAKLFEEDTLKVNTTPIKLATTPKKSQKTTESPSTSTKKLLHRTNVSRFGEAKKCLSLSHPEQVVGREDQIKILRKFLETNLTQTKQAKTPRKKCYKMPKRSIYVSGPPGTGKTTSLRKLIDEFPIEENNVRVVPIVNCMTLGTSGGIFGKVVDVLCPRKSYSSASEAQKILETEVVSSKQTILLVLDEIDQLDSKSQEVLYSLFELPYLNKSKLVLVGIANALDLTDRILPRLKMHEGFSPAELTFPAYSKSEILAILKTRLAPFMENTDKPLFQSPALMFLAGKISAVSGDIRKALDVCQRALILAEIEDRNQTRLKLFDQKSEEKPAVALIGIPQIIKVVNEIYCSSVTTAMRNGTNDDLPLQQKMLIASLLLMSNHLKNKDITLGKLHATYIRVCKKRSLPQVDLSEAGSLCGLLESRGILSMKLGPMSKWASSTKDKKVSLRIDEGEIEAALKDKTLLSGILKDVDCVAK